MDLKIKHYDGLCNTPANLFIMKAYVDLVEKGYAANTSGGNWQDKVIAAFIDDKIVGVLTYEKVNWNKSIVIKLGYIDKDFRRQKIYTQLWNELILIAKKLEISIIEGGTDVRNNEMRKTMESLGRVEIASFFTYEIK